MRSSGPWRGRRSFLLLAAGGTASVLAAAPALAQVSVGRSSVARNLVPADDIEQAGAQQYTQLTAEARGKGALLPDDQPQVQRPGAVPQQALPAVSDHDQRR